jgi:hypothetical protein
LSRTLFHKVAPGLVETHKMERKCMPIIYLIVQFAWSKCGKLLIIQGDDPLTGFNFEPEISQIQF